MTLISIDCVIKEQEGSAFCFNLLSFAGCSLLYFYVDNRGTIDFDFLFLKKPVLWIVEKIKNLFGGK